MFFTDLVFADLLFTDLLFTDLLSLFSQFFPFLIKYITNELSMINIFITIF